MPDLTRQCGQDVAAMRGREAVVARMTGRIPRVERWGSDRMPVGIHIGLGAAAVLAGVMVAALLPASAGSWRLAPVAAMLAIVGAGTVDPAAVAAAATLAYLLVVGFVVNQYGVLTWHGTPDIYRLMVTALSAGAGLAAGAAWRWARRPQPLTVPAEWAGATRALPDERMLTTKEDLPGV
jgi:hypothetical protein